MWAPNVPLLQRKTVPSATALTNCSRGIRNAWHFHYALSLVIKVVC
ncbi:DUF3265 domain-containing protein, partial [Vibrio vulnificus]